MRGWIVFLGIVMGCTSTAFGAVWYVDKDNTSGTEDGTTWAMAFTTIQPAIDAASTAGGGEVWVAEGTYSEERVSYPHSEYLDINTGSILMKENVHLYGGFDGNETELSQRNWKTHETILDGSTAREGSNAYHVVVGANNSTLDGFVVSGGKTPEYLEGSEDSRQSGGGMNNCYASAVAVTNCTFKGNTARYYGGGMYYGTATNCTFTDNSANNLGGGLYWGTAMNCTFTGNSADNGGGMMHGTATNCIFTGNSAYYSGGGIYLGTAMNCTFTGNSASNGGGMCEGTATNCIFWTDSSPELKNTTVAYSCIMGGYEGEGNTDQDPQFEDADNGLFLLLPNSPCVDTGTSPGSPTSDIRGIVRPQGSGVDMGAYEYFEDGDGLPYVYEISQGCDPYVADAALWARLTYPSAGATFQTAPLMLKGIRSSQYVNEILLSFDGGATFTETAALNGLEWTYDWTPPQEDTYDIIVRASNIFGGFVDSEKVRIHYWPNMPCAVIASPVSGMHIQGTISIEGSALSGQLGFVNYAISYGPGSDPTAIESWTELLASTLPVDNGVLFSDWDVSELPAGPYVVKLSVTDGVGFDTVETWISIEVNHDTTTVNIPSLLSIEGGLLATAVAPGGEVNVIGMSEPGMECASAKVTDGSGKAILADVTDYITIHGSGSIRGMFTLPTPLDAGQVILEMQIKDAVGNLSNTVQSNALLVDNSAPQVTIVFPKTDATLPADSILVSGIATDIGAASVAKVEFSTDGGETWLEATGTEMWAYGWTPDTEGPYTLTVRATDAVGNTGSASVSVTINSAFPSAYITSPFQGKTVLEGETLDIIGTANDATNFSRYKLQWALGVSPTTGWADITEMTYTPVQDALLGQWNTTDRVEGIHTIRLIVADESSNIMLFEMQVLIRARMSIAGLPDVSTAEDTAKENVMHLPDYAAALGQDAEALTYSIVGNTHPECGVVINEGKNIDIHPDANWFGTSAVTIQVTDGTLTDTDMFQVTVISVNDAPEVRDGQIGMEADKGGVSLTLNYTYYDVEEDPFTAAEIRWKKNGVAQLQYNNQRTIPSSATTRGEEWLCEVRIYDGFTWSAWTQIGPVAIPNTPPTTTADGVMLTPEPATIWDTPYCYLRILRSEWR